MGSSPRVWGQEHISLMCLLMQGIIPTRVGTRATSDLTSSSVGDHPHACGDKIWALFLAFSYLGSSPRVWGQVTQGAAVFFRDGIIPTRVGTRRTSRLMQDVCWDHPHACGDKPVSDIATKSRGGSSPRVWGQVYRKQKVRWI